VTGVPTGFVGGADTVLVLGALATSVRMSRTTSPEQGKRVVNSLLPSGAQATPRSSRSAYPGDNATVRYAAVSPGQWT
jgi:hypothetical protein